MPSSKLQPHSTPPSDTLTFSAAGRGSTAGWCHCPYCPPRSKKLFAYGRGLAAHLLAIHPALPYPSNVSVSAPGLTRALLPRAPGPSLVAHVAARDNDIATLASLPPSDRAARDHNGATALDWAAGGGNIGAMKLLMGEIGLAPAPAKKMRHGRTPAHWAARNSRVAALEVLLDAAPALLTTPTADGTLPIHLACYSGDVETVAFLWARYAGGDDWRRQKNNWGCGVLHFACLRANEAVLEYLRGVLGEEFAGMFAEENCEGVTAEKKLEWARKEIAKDEKGKGKGG